MAMDFDSWNSHFQPPWFNDLTASNVILPRQAVNNFVPVTLLCLSLYHATVEPCESGAG
jgi:hypothetical protein